MAQDQHRCDYCDTETINDRVQLCLWEDGQPVIIEDIPARVCNNCYEQYYDEITQFKVQQLRMGGLSKSDADKVIEVPIFSFESLNLEAGNHQ